MPKRSKYQEKVIKDFYKNREAISLQKLAELVTELYLAEGKARDRDRKANSKARARKEKVRKRGRKTKRS